jgi:MOSC domain-containing protein YiiM
MFPGLYPELTNTTSDRPLRMKTMPPTGTVHSINASNGGVPKTPRGSARVSVNGIEGDRQRDRRVHGGPDRAVCVYSYELIQRLRADGHPIEPGSIGENLTLSGIDWAAMMAGTIIEVGTATLEVTRPTTPCKTIAESFLDRNFTRVSEKVCPGWSRYYCRVLQEGVVATGDRVIVAGLRGGIE